MIKPCVQKSFSRDEGPGAGSAQVRTQSNPSNAPKPNASSTPPKTIQVLPANPPVKPSQHQSPGAAPATAGPATHLQIIAAGKAAKAAAIIIQTWWREQADRKKAPAAAEPLENKEVDLAAAAGSNIDKEVVLAEDQTQPHAHVAHAMQSSNSNHHVHSTCADDSCNSDDQDHGCERDDSDSADNDRNSDDEDRDCNSDDDDSNSDDDDRMFDDSDDAWDADAIALAPLSRYQVRHPYKQRDKSQIVTKHSHESITSVEHERARDGMKGSAERNRLRHEMHETLHQHPVSQPPTPMPARSMPTPHPAPAPISPLSDVLGHMLNSAQLPREELEALQQLSANPQQLYEMFLRFTPIMAGPSLPDETHGAALRPAAGAAA